MAYIYFLVLVTLICRVRLIGIISTRIRYGIEFTLDALREGTQH